MTAKEIAVIIDEASREAILLGEKPGHRDWVLDVLERREQDNDGQLFQSVRAELYRMGWRHSASEEKETLDMPTKL